MTYNEKELYRFVNEPTYRKKVIADIRSEQDSQYEKRLKTLISEKENLISSRAKEIDRLSKTRWESVASGKLLVNTAEGKVKFNQTEFLFSDIKGAEPNEKYTSKVVTHESGTSKKNASLGGAILGGLVLGGVGAVAGGIGLGKGKSNGTSTSTESLICSHLGVLVNVNGFISEIILLMKPVQQSNFSYITAVRDAQDIISKLIMVSKMPVPTTTVKVEDESSVKDFDGRILDIETEIQAVSDAKLTYKIPEIYRTTEQKDMSDEEYVAYLDSTDSIRAEERLLQKKAEEERKVIEKKEADERRAVKRKETRERSVKTIKTGFNVFVGIIGWAISILTLILVLGAILEDGIASCIVLTVSALLINPSIYKCLKSKMKFLRVWMVVLLFIVTFILGASLLPTSI